MDRNLNSEVLNELNAKLPWFAIALAEHQQVSTRVRKVNRKRNETKTRSGSEIPCAANTQTEQSNIATHNTLPPIHAANVPIKWAASNCIRELCHRRLLHTY